MLSENELTELQHENEHDFFNEISSKHEMDTLSALSSIFSRMLEQFPTTIQVILSNRFALFKKMQIFFC
jgi:hypothetical protein